MIVKTRDGKEFDIPANGNIKGFRIDSVEICFKDLRELMKEDDKVVLDWLRDIYHRAC